jgi:decaprenyl-phosphate phosphoribosyltransferase
MKTISTFFRLLRVKQWIKNLLIFAAPLGGGIEPSWSAFRLGCLGFFGFSLTASAVYILNDYRDREMDRNHPKKKYRPIASREIPEKFALVIFSLLLLIAFLLIKSFSFASILTVFCYLIINIAYTLKLKTFPVLELGIVASGYSLRILFGAQIFSLVASSWLMVSTFSAAFGVVAAKRLAEMEDSKRSSVDKRQVLSEYSSLALQSTATMAFGTAFTTYSLWLFEHSVDLQILPLACEMLALVLAAFLLIESGRGRLETPEDIVHSRKFTSIFSVFVFLNLILLYI